MPGDGEVDTSRKTVKTFVPAYQKDEWKRHADELDMSQSEFVRTMVQAGRSDFDVETVHRPEPDSESDSSDEVDSDDAPASVADSGTSDGGDLEQHVLSVLSTADYLSWDELVEELTNDIEDRLEDSLQRLQTENRIQYSGRRGGYTLTGDDGD